MFKSWAMGYLLLLGASSRARAACDALDNNLDVPSPLTEDTTITLSVGVIDCPALDADTNPREVERITVEGGTLTIKSDDAVQFINVAFEVNPGAALVFDMPDTVFGPNDESREDNASGTLLETNEDSSLTFNGDVAVREIENVGRIIKNVGSMEFKKTVLIENNINAIPENTGTLTFGGDSTIRGNDGVGIDNFDGGIVSFEARADFEDNGSQLEGAKGCDVTNDSDSDMGFQGSATFSNTNCRSSEGTSLYNAGTMTFFGEARFNDIIARGNGGAVLNDLGSLTFQGDVQFNNNDASLLGGGIAIDGGDVTFQKAVTFRENTAESGGAFALLVNSNFNTGEVFESGFGSLTFEEPALVSFEDNFVDTRTSFGTDDDCTVGKVEEGTTLIGFPGDDVCVTAT